MKNKLIGKALSDGWLRADIAVHVKGGKPIMGL
jgi:hypothetical protein